MNNNLSIISLAIALSSLILTFVIFKITKDRQNYQNLIEQISVYFGPEMLLAISRMWNLYREYGDSKFVDKYIFIMKSENKELDSIPAAERLDFQTGTLHYQRRLVTQFWRGLAILIKNNLVPRKAVFAWWSQDDVEIVGKILIPIENRLTEYHRVSELNPKTDPLYYLVGIRNKFYK